LLVGRPDLIVSTPITITPNTPWQVVPSGMFCLLSLQGPASEIWKVTLEDLDYSQISDSGWEQDIGNTVQRWAPLGLSKFIVWPSVAQEQTVLATGIASPIDGVWPFADTTTVPFADQFFAAIEKYAACYLRLKEGGQETQEGYKLYQEYLMGAKELTRIEDRADPFLFTPALGGVQTSNPTTSR